MDSTSEKIKNHLKNNSHFYVSITGLKVKSIWKFIFFAKHAVASKIQADTSPGVLYVDVKKINGIHHTLTVWENQAAMKKYIYSGHHLKAIKVFKKIATGKTFGYESQTIPSWDEVHEKWKANGIEY